MSFSTINNLQKKIKINCNRWKIAKEFIDEDEEEEL